MFKVLYSDCGKHCIKSVRIRSYTGSYFPAFGINTERYGVAPNTDTFHLVKMLTKLLANKIKRSLNTICFTKHDVKL